MDNCSLTRAIIFTEFGWRVDPAFGSAGLEVILAAGRALNRFAGEIHPGRGNIWTRAFSTGTRFHCGGLPQKAVTYLRGGSATSVVFPKRDIWLAPEFYQSLSAVQHVLHELAHVLDNRSAPGILPAVWLGGGWGDSLIYALGGKPKGLRWTNGSCGLPPAFLWSNAVNLAYGNHSSADYFAEAFSWSIMKPIYCLSPQVVDLIRELIKENTL